MTDRSGDWLRQADADLQHAELSAREGDFEWACFAAQQSAEKAVKALYLSHRADPQGRSLLVLLQSLPKEVSAILNPDLLDSAKALDKQYMPTGYPNGFALGAPLDYFTERDARESISHAKSFLEFCKAQVCRP